jgi:hypothetical protein
MGSELVIFSPPSFNFFSGILKGKKPIYIVMLLKLERLQRLRFLPFLKILPTFYIKNEAAIATNHEHQC